MATVEFKGITYDLVQANNPKHPCKECAMSLSTCNDYMMETMFMPCGAEFSPSGLCCKIHSNMDNTTICACATGQGGAISIIRVSGPDAFSISGKSLACKSSNIFEKSTFHYAHFIDRQGNIIDDVIVSSYKNPHSYTGEDCVEISCHASTYIVTKILETLISNGCKPAEPGEFTKRAFMNGKLDLSQAEAVADLIASKNKASHDIAMNQLKGKISDELFRLVNKLLDMTTLIELELDFSEEDVEFADRSKLKNLGMEIKNKLMTLISSFEQGNAIKEGIPVAIIGAPNVGKSSLLNELLNEDKAIVTDIAGTTRDIIEDTMSINGILFRFIDTAGIRHTTDKVESIGIERSYNAASKAKIIIMMSDPDNDYPTINNYEGKYIIKVKNKTDEFSVLNNIGISELKDNLVEYANSFIGNNEDLIITNVRHVEAFKSAVSFIDSAIKKIDDNTSGEFLAEDLRMCIEHLEEVIGKTFTSQDVLANIFKNFCIGK